jgi:hypothetical protein
MLVFNAAKDDNNDWDFDLKLTNDEVNYLVNVGISQLLTAGTITLEEQQGQQEVNLPCSPNATVN